jgi:hypothetical protein
MTWQNLFGNFEIDVNDSCFDWIVTLMIFAFSLCFSVDLRKEKADDFKVFCTRLSLWTHYEPFIFGVMICLWVDCAYARKKFAYRRL